MGHRTVKIAEELAEEVDDLVGHRWRGYRSRAELVSDAVRRFLDEQDTPTPGVNQEQATLPDTAETAA